MFYELNQWFAPSEVPVDETGCLGAIGEMLFEFGPSLVFLAGHSAQVLAVDAAGAAAYGEEVRALAAALEESLRTRRLCLFEYVTCAGPRLAFGVRLSPATVGCVVGGLVLCGDGVQERLAAKAPCLIACGNLAWSVLEERSAVKRMMARKDQLKIEYETLRTAHVQTLSQVLEEQQKRVEAEKSYSQRLEQEVERRSAELREALDDATRKSLKLQQYSISLENANVALEELNRAAAAANEAKTQFLAAVSHELRTPMTAILGYSELLLEESTPGSKQRESLQIVKRNGEHLLEVINNILDLAKVEAGRFDVQLRPCSPREMVRDACALMELRAKAKGISLATEFADVLPDLVEVDQTCLKQILLNLIGNAIKFTEKGGVRVTVRRAGGTEDTASLVLEVADTGIGVSRERLRAIFEPFTQGDASMARHFGGTGLGLTVSKRLAELLGGEIAVESQPGQGSVFRVTIPLRPFAHAGPAEAQAEAGPARPGQPDAETPADRQEEEGASILNLACRILLVEDSLDNQRFLAAVLRIAGATVTTVEDGQAAVETIYPPRKAGREPDGGREAPVDLILMDMQMPTMDGYTAARTLREKGCTTPIVALTAHAMAGERERCLACGCDEYLSKPVDRKRLLSLVARLVQPGRPESARTP